MRAATDLASRPVLQSTAPLTTESQPPPDIELPKPLHPFFRIGPLILIPGSMCVAGSLMILSDALRWYDFWDGLRVMSVYGSVAIVVIGIVQGLLALLFMRRVQDRAWWRSCLVLFPAMAMSFLSLKSLAGLYPHESRARREMGGMIGGPMPASVSDTVLAYRGGMDPRWDFHFTIAAEDFERLCSYRAYQRDGAFRLQLIKGETTFYLRYDPVTGRASYSVIFT